MRKAVRSSVALFFAALLPTSAAVIFDSGDSTFSATGTQFGRLARDGVPSDWSAQKDFPGVTGASAVRGYETYTVNSGPYRYIQVNFDDPVAVLFISAYLTAYLPVNSSPLYGLDTNYLGDPGLTEPLGFPSFFQLFVGPGTNIVLPINEVSPSGGGGAPFRLIVEGFYDAAYSEVPEPGAAILTGCGLVGVLLRKRVRRGLAAGLVFLTGSAIAVAQTAVSPVVLQQIDDLLQEKRNRTPAERKMASKLVYAVKAASGQALTPTLNALPEPMQGVDISAAGALVDLNAQASTDLLSAISRASGRVIYSAPARNRIRARIPLFQIQGIAARTDVTSIKAAGHAKTSGMLHPSGLGRGGASPKPFEAMMFNLASRLGLSFLTTGSLTTQGVVSHSVTTARSTYGVLGTGVRVGVLSDSAEATPLLIGTGDLPIGTTIVEEIIDGPGSSEGTAMMEIVHDIAPGAQLFFASAFNSSESFADNIRKLRTTYGCDVIVDDVSYSDESPFQDGPIAQAVNDVTAAGAIYFSSAGNSGNLTNGNSSAWEGDFAAGQASGPYVLHSFGTSNGNRLRTLTGVVDLFWSDPLGASSNDYDLFILNAAGTAIIAASTSDQTGTQDPLEEVYAPSGFPANSIILIAKLNSAQPRALHLENFFGEPLQFATSGNTRSHAAGPSAVGVAAVAWNSARMGTRPFTGGATNPTESFSSDGPRRMFFNPDGSAITPFNFLFGTNGGVTLTKPDIAAADAVTTKTPGFNPFFGTSAAAPHAAGIAALIKSAKPSLTPAQIRSAMTSTALDIRAPGLDRDSGYGIVMAPASIAKALTLK